MTQKVWWFLALAPHATYVLILMFYDFFYNNIIFDVRQRRYRVEPKASEHADRILEKCEEGVQVCCRWENPPAGWRNAPALILR
jgi:predicted RNA-binding protein with PUA domain